MTDSLASRLSEIVALAEKAERIWKKSWADEIEMPNAFHYSKAGRALIAASSPSVVAAMARVVMAADALNEATNRMDEDMSAALDALSDVLTGGAR